MGTIYDTITYLYHYTPYQIHHTTGILYHTKPYRTKSNHIIRPTHRILLMRKENVINQFCRVKFKMVKFHVNFAKKFDFDRQGHFFSIGTYYLCISAQK